MRSYELRLSAADDYEFCFQLNKTNMQGLVERLRGWDEEAERNDMREQFKPGHDQIIMVDDQRAGHLGVDERESMIYLRMIALLPEYQNQGIGSALISSILAEARRKGKVVRLIVSKFNPSALRLYERLGFVVTEEVAVESRGVRCLMTATP